MSYLHLRQRDFAKPQGNHSQKLRWTLHEETEAQRPRLQANNTRFNGLGSRLIRGTVTSQLKLLLRGPQEHNRFALPPSSLRSTNAVSNLSNEMKLSQFSGLLACNRHTMNGIQLMTL